MSLTATQVARVGSSTISSLMQGTSSYLYDKPRYLLNNVLNIIMNCDSGQDWIYGYVKTNLFHEYCPMSAEPEEGLIPKSYVRQVVREVDEVCVKTKAIIRDICSKRKRLWLTGKYDPHNLKNTEKRAITQRLDNNTGEMLQLLRTRIHCYNKLGSYFLQENKDAIVDKANEISKDTHENFIVDRNLNNILTTEKPITEILDFYRKPDTLLIGSQRKKDRSKCYDETFYVISLLKYKSESAEKVDAGTLNLVLGIFDSAKDTFVTEFIKYQDLKAKNKKNKNIRFAIPKDFESIPGLFLVGLVMLVDKVGANKCQGVGVIKLRTVMDPPENGENYKNIKIPILFSRNLAVPVTETIQKLSKGDIGARDMTELLLSTFEVKKLDRFYLDQHDFIFEKNVTEPTLRERGVHKFILTIDSGRFSGGQRLFGESFDISLDIEVLDEEGLIVECIKSFSTDQFSSSYKAITSPTNNRCEWKENVHIELRENWKNIHLRFNFYKHHDSYQSKPYGFAFLKCCTENGVFIFDGPHNLNVYQIHRHQTVDVRQQL